MKTCYKCGLLKNLNAFHKNARQSDGYQTYCKDCAKIRNREYYLATPERNQQRRAGRVKLIERARKFVWNYLSKHPCVDCGESDIVVLEFDHVRDTKVRDISEMVRRGNSILVIENEIEKCEVRCANCHRRVTAQRGNWSILQHIPVG